MSYTPTEWQNGDTVTAEKLNKLEQGVEDAGGVFVVTATFNNPSEVTDADFGELVLNKTYAEISGAMADGYLVYINIPTEAAGVGPIIGTVAVISAGKRGGGTYAVGATSSDGEALAFDSDTADGPLACGFWA